MQNLIRKDKFEELLLSQWASFMDITKLLSYVLSCARDITYPITKTKIKQRGTQLKLSRFEPQNDGFIIWAEFSFSRDSGTVIGTSELFLNPNGEINHIQTQGQFFI